jgi:hypothetical protein
MLCEELSIRDACEAKKSIFDPDLSVVVQHASSSPNYKTSSTHLSTFMASRTQEDPSGAHLIRTMNAVVDVCNLALIHRHNHLGGYADACFRGGYSKPCNRHSRSRL